MAVSGGGGVLRWSWDRFCIARSYLGSVGSVSSVNLTFIVVMSPSDEYVSILFEEEYDVTEFIVII